MPAADLLPADHRSRSAQLRRERTRARLLDAAFVVFAAHGPDARVIDRVISTAGMARGTFYNYFRSNEELFLAVANMVSDEVLRLVEPLVLQHADPARRIACGVGSVLRLAQQVPLIAEFIVRGGPAAICQGGLANEVVPRDIRAGIAQERFAVAHERLAFDTILGCTIMACHGILSGQHAPAYPQDSAAMVLRALGIPGDEAARLAAGPWPELELPADSLFARLPAPRQD